MNPYIRFIRVFTTIMEINAATAVTTTPMTLFGRIQQRRRKAAAVIFAAIVSCVVLMPARVAAQDVRNTQNAADSKNRSGAQVDPATGAMQLQIPLGEYKGRGGVSLPITLSYSSKLWTLRYLNSSTYNGDVYNRYQPKYSEQSTSGWTSSLDWFAPNNCPGTDCPPPTLHDNWYDLQGHNVSGSTYHHAVARMFFTLPDGSRHELRRSDTPVTAPGDTTTGTFYSVDGSRLRYESATRTLFMPDGSRYAVSTDVNGVPTQYAYIDRNGNTLTGVNGVLTDTLQRPFSMPPLSDNAPMDYDYTVPGVGGALLHYTIRWRNLADVLTDPQALRLRGDRLLSNPRLPSGGSSLFTSPTGEEAVTSNGSIFNPVVMSQIVLPNGTAYTFTYNVWGEINKIISPTGAVETFTYGQIQSVSGQMEGDLYGQTNRGVTARSVMVAGAPTANWQYGSGLETSAIPYRLTRTITAPDNSFTEILYHTSRGADIKNGFDDARAGKAYDERVYAYQGGPMLRRKLTEWMYTGPVPFDNNSTATRDARVDKEVEMILDTGGDALASTTTYGYDSDLNVTSTNRYGYASVVQATAQTGAITSIPQGALLRTEETDYLTSNQAYRDRNLLALPTATRVKDAVGNIVAQSQMFYDETPLTAYGSVTNWSDPGTTARGNPTRTRSWVDTSNTWLETRAEYDQCGNLLKSIDARGNQSQVEYAAAYAYAYPTHIISAVPDTSGAYGSNTSLETWTTYDASTGLVTSTTDANNKTTTYEYNDSLNRVTKVNRPDGGRTTNTYVDAHQCGQYVETRTLLDSSGREADSFQFFDGLGRPSLTESNDHQDANNPWLRVDTQYDVMGRVLKVSNPYRTAGCTSTANPSGRWTTTGYDKLGRVLTVTTPDGAAVASSYSGQYVTVTDQAGKSRRSRTDALGRLVRVDEPDASGNLGTASAPVQPTSYAYDVLGNLRQVMQGTQNRFFMYDSLSRLVRAKNPEQAVNANLNTGADPVSLNTQWSMAYGYDNNGNLTARVDARGVTTTYAYDALNRPTTVRYTDGTKDIDRHYDGATNGRGRFYYFNYDPNNNARFDSLLAIDEYDGMGRVRTYRQHFLTNGAVSPAYTVRRTYDLAGHVTSQTYPSGHTVAYTYDAAGRTFGMTGNIGDGVARTYAANISYDVMGGMREEQFGTQTPLYHKLHYNARGQLFDIRLSTASLQTNEWEWNRGALVNYYSANYEWGGSPGSSGSGADNNGNLRRSQHFVPADEAISAYTYTQETYQYDALNRLASMSEDNGTNTAASPTSGAQGYDYDRWGNRTISIDPARTWGAMPRPQFTVDAASNRLGVPAGQAGAMTYDAAGNLTFDSYTGHGARGYDGENRMVTAQDNLDLNDTYTYDADGHRIKRKVGGTEVWQLYGMDGELLAEYPAGNAPFAATKEYGYRAGELLVTASSGDDARARRFVQNLYYGALHRDPTAAELQQQTDTLSQAGVQGLSQLQTTAAQMARSLFTSTAYETSPYKTDTQYVSDLYNTYLQRGADAGGVNFWAGQVPSSGRANVCNAFEASTEFQTLVATLYGTSASDNQRTEQYVNDFYLGAYGRNATSTELQQGRDALNAAAAQGQAQVQTQAETMGRALFAGQVTDTSITDTQYVTNLYAGFLQRGADDGGLNFWVGQAASSRQNVLNAFATSGAARALSATLYREVNWLVADHLGTPRMIVDKSGLLSGVKRHDYLPFGEELGAGVGGRTTAQGYGQVDGVRNRFTGQQRDDETGLDYFNARYYSSTQGRFSSPDSFGGRGTNPQTLNLYSYVLNNPLKFRDPTGHHTEFAGHFPHDWVSRFTGLLNRMNLYSRSFFLPGLRQDQTTVQVQPNQPTSVRIGHDKVTIYFGGYIDDQAGGGSWLRRMWNLVQPTAHAEDTEFPNGIGGGGGAGGGGSAQLPEFISGSASEDIPEVTLWRGVSEAEFDDILRFGDYGLSPSQAGKYFSFTKEGVFDFVNSPFNSSQRMTVTSIDVRRDILQLGFHFNDPSGGGPSVHFNDDVLPLVYNSGGLPTIHYAPWIPSVGTPPQ